MPADHCVQKPFGSEASVCQRGSPPLLQFGERMVVALRGTGVRGGFAFEPPPFPAGGFPAQGFPEPVELDLVAGRDLAGAF